jgi:hypothetical protein
MKFNFKKIASVIATTVMLGSTVAFASAAWPAPFVSSGAADAAIVVGATAAASDTVAATDLGATLDKSVTAATGAGTLTGTGDKTGVDNPSARRIYYGDSLNAAKTSVGSSEMPTVLADGKVVDLSGVEYKYTQTIILGDTVNVYGTSGGDIKDPTLYLDVGTTASDPLYNYTLSFTKNLNVSDSVNVQGQKIKILGVDYVIGASSTNSTLYLYGAGQTVSMNGGESKKVTIAGKEHSVDFVGATGTTTAKITLDGVSKTVTKGNSYAFAGDVNVYVKDVTYQSYAGGLQSVELIVGANTLLLQNGQTVKVGADQTTVQGTNVVLTPAGHGIISALTVQIAAKKSQTDSIAIGDSLTDPVFGGFKVQLVSINPTLADASRGKVKVDTDNNQYAYVTFTSARDGGKGEQRLTFVYDSNTASSTVTPVLAHQSNASSNKGVIHVAEGDNAQINDWIVVNQGDAGTILQVEDISINTGTEGTVRLFDAITGDSQTVTVTNSSGTYSKTGVNFFGGNGYTIAVNGAGTSMNITWSSGAKTLFPRIKMKNGGWIAFLTDTTVANATSVIFPDGLTTLATTGTTVHNGTTATSTVLVNGINWTIRDNAGSPRIVGLGNPSCNFTTSATTGPAILVIEPKRWNDASYGNYICVPTTATGSSPEVTVSTPVFNGTNSGFITYDSDTYKSAAVDQYGAFVTMESRTNENGVATITLPQSQMYFDVQLTADSVVSSSKAGITVVKDSEVASVKDKNLVVVGGSCINQAAAMILTGKTDALCGAAFADKTSVGAGKYLVQVAASPYNAQKVAMLVAGYDAADTTNAVAKVKEGKESTDVGSKKVYPLATA